MLTGGEVLLEAALFAEIISAATFIIFFYFLNFGLSSLGRCGKLNLGRTNENGRTRCKRTPGIFLPTHGGISKSIKI